MGHPRLEGNNKNIAALIDCRSGDYSLCNAVLTVSRYLPTRVGQFARVSVDGFAVMLPARRMQEHQTLPLNRAMNLQLHLLTRIALVALACLLVIAAFVLYQSHCVAKQTTGQIAESLGKQLESQLLLINAGLGQTNPFPDFEPWKQSGNQPGICLSYTPADNSLPRSLCNGSKLSQAEWPTLFETGYRQIFYSRFASETADCAKRQALRLPINHAKRRTRNCRGLE